MTKDEALKMAYKAEETGNLQDLIDAVNALMEALEQKGFDAGINVGNKEKSSNNPNEVGLEQPNNERKSIMQPTYYEKTIAGEYVKASPQPVRIEQPEIKLADGITVEEWHELREPKEQPAFGECGNKSCGGHGACYCEEQPVMAISQMNNDALKNALNNQGKLSVSSPQPQPAQEPVAWMKSALDNARDVCKYLDHDMVKEAKAHTKFFWGDIDKIKEDEEALEQPSQEPVATVAVDNFGNISVGWIKNPNHNDKLYTHSHQWQGLTDDEIDAEALKDDGAAYFALGALWANKKLKEKNHG